MTNKQTSPLQPDIPLLDREGALKRLQNDTEFLNVLYDAFLEDLPNKLKAIDEAVSSGQIQLMQRTSHSLKGAAATVGAAALRETALAMEMAAREGDTDRVNVLYPELKSKAGQTQREMSGVLENS